MDRVFASGAAGTPPSAPVSPSIGYSSPGNPGTATPPSKPGAYWYHMITESLRKVITDAGLTPDHTNLSLLSQAIQALIAGVNQKSVVVKSVTFAAGVASGTVVRWDTANSRFDKAVANSTSSDRAVGIADVTNLAVYLFGECAIFSGLTPGARYYLDPTTAGALTTTVPADAVLVGIAKSATTMWVDIDPALAAPTNDFLVYQDQRVSGTVGPAYAGSAWETVTLSNEVTDTANIGGLSANQITLPAGSYEFTGSASLGIVGSGRQGRLRLKNVTDNTTIIQGSQTSANGAANSGLACVIQGQFTLAASKTIQLQAYVIGATSATPAVTSGDSEIYASLMLRRYSA